MGPSPKFLLVIFFAALLHAHGFSQADSSGIASYKFAETIASEEPERAFHFLEKALTVSRRKNNWELYINSLNQLASLKLEENTELRDEVFAMLKEAVQLLKNSGKTSGLALVHLNTANFYYLHDHNIEQAVYHYEVAKNIWYELDGQWEAEIANCYHGIGDVYKYLKSDFLEAEKAYETALQIRESIAFGDTRILFRNHYNLATTNRSQRDFEKALSYGTKALEIAKKMDGNIYQEMTHGVVAGIYRDMGESKLAKQHYNIAIALNRQTDDPKKALGWYYQGLGESFKNDSLYAEAIENFLIARHLYQKDNASPSLATYLLQLMADTYAVVGNEKKFHSTIRELFDTFNSLGMVHGRQASEAFILIGNYHYRKDQIDSALHYYQQALIASIPGFRPKKIEENPTEVIVGYHYYVHAALSKKASAFRRKFSAAKDSRYWLNALECLRLAEKLMSQERNTLDMQDAQWEFLDRNYDIYEDIVSLLYDGNGQLPLDTLYSLAFRYFEQSKSRTLADALITAERTTQINRQDTLFNKHAQLRRDLLTAQDKLNQEVESENRPGVVTKLREEIVRVDRSIQRCKIEIENKFPGYFNAKYGYQSAALPDIQNVISNDDRVILEYFWGQDWIYGLAISKDEILFKKIGQSRTVKPIIDSLLLHFSGGSVSTSLRDFDRFASNAYLLHEYLVRPFGQILTNRHHLQINPDGPISQVPFEIIIEEEGSREAVDYRSMKFMIKSFAISYAYSSSTLLHRPRSAVRKPSFLAVGLVQGDSGSVLEKTEVGRRELDLLSKRFADGKFLTGNAATESNFKRMSPDVDIIHLAIHGTGDVNKDFSASLYFNPERDNTDDGELHAYELYGLKLNAAMAVLTACESGLGKGYKGEGMMSMASAFTYSGCENILMSLWKVNDQASNFLMDDFYTELLNGLPIDEALRGAKLRYLEQSDELSADPKIWAPLVAYGTASRVIRPSFSYKYIFGAGVAVVAIVFLISMRRKSSF